MNDTFETAKKALTKAMEAGTIEDRDSWVRVVDAATRLSATEADLSLRSASSV